MNSTLISHPAEYELSALHDGQLESSRADDVARHVQNCESCALEMRRLVTMTDLVRSIELAGLTPLVQARLHQHAASIFAGGIDSSLVRFGMRISGIAASILLLGSIGLFVGGQNRAVLQAAPPWVGVAVSSDADTVVQNASTPAAAIYLADASSSGEWNK